mmetsp:Transcript_32244/g.75977  ORF Transcript_32244/g.75977 Transcript_32244/m.75977 type:complete len:330 (-) Transcript_32244:85-1074(-)
MRGPAAAAESSAAESLDLNGEESAATASLPSFGTSNNGRRSTTRAVTLSMLPRRSASAVSFFAARWGLRSRWTMAAASLEDITSQSPSEASTRKSSPLTSVRCLISGSADTHFFNSLSPKPREVASTPLTRAHPQYSTVPPFWTMRLRSEGLSGLWSSLIASAVLPWHRMVRLSPAFATNSSLPNSSAVVTVLPSPSPSFAACARKSPSVLRNAPTNAFSGSEFWSIWSRFRPRYSLAHIAARFPECPSKTPKKDEFPLDPKSILEKVKSSMYGRRPCTMLKPTLGLCPPPISNPSSSFPRSYPPPPAHRLSRYMTAKTNPGVWMIPKR